MTTGTESITELDTHTCLGLLRTREVGRLAVSITDHPDIFPINYVLDRGTIVFRTAEGTKLAASVLGRGVAFEIDGYEPDAGDAWSVVVKGYAIEIEKLQSYFDALDLPLFPWHAGPKHRFVRIEPVQITGRRFQAVGHDDWGRRPTDDASSSAGVTRV
jgi:nitroimidazol reductase NimA-like FMN-containing flavoprotein (pyridoxamine 5'-phosphate oxidase superfamily)